MGNPTHSPKAMSNIKLTMWPGDLAPDNSDLGAPLLRRTLVDVGDLLAEIEASRIVSS